LFLDDFPFKDLETWEERASIDAGKNKPKEACSSPGLSYQMENCGIHLEVTYSAEPMKIQQCVAWHCTINEF